MPEPTRERLEADVLIVGAGPAGLSCALRLTQLIREYQHGAGLEPAPLSPESIYVIEKGSEIGAHSLSGAVLDPKALRKLVPDYETCKPPLGTPVADEAVYFLTEGGRWKLPVTPPYLRNHGNLVVSLNQLVKWMGRLAEDAGANLFPGIAGAELLYEGERVVGVRTDDKGLDRNGHPKPNFQPGYDIHAQVTVLAEGPRGSLSKQAIQRLHLDRGSSPQNYSIGVKELWEVPPGRLKPGTVIHTAGWPLEARQFGGGFLYALTETRLAVGLVVGLDERDPRFDAHNAFQRYKTHPWLREQLHGGQMVRYGAKTIPEGGYFAIPRTVADGLILIGDAAGFLNSQRLKGIHLAMKTGMLAAETIFDALLRRDSSAEALRQFERRWQTSWVKEELWRARNYRQSFGRGLWSATFHVGLQLATCGRGLRSRYRSRPDYESMQRLEDCQASPPPKTKPDGKLTFDKLSDVYHSGTRHEENQPSHLHIADFNICNGRCIVEYGNPCQYFCPAAVYEMETDSGGQGKHLRVNSSNCVHCKTCDIADPYQIITWVPPEGGGGPHYDGM